MVKSCSAISSSRNLCTQTRMTISTTSSYLALDLVLGTFIVEWDAGRAIADKLLATEESSKMCVERLTELAVALGFDGLLLNMEVSLNISQIPILKTFVSHLTQTMHSAIPGSLVIWYDSVTIEGSLSYQNELNDKNDILVRESKAQEAEEGLASMASN